MIVRVIRLGIAIASMLLTLGSASFAKDGDRWVCSYADIDRKTRSPFYIEVNKYLVKNGWLFETNQSYSEKYQILLDDSDNLVATYVGADNTGVNVQVIIIRKKPLTFTSDWVTNKNNFRNPISGQCIED